MPSVGLMTGPISQPMMYMRLLPWYLPRVLGKVKSLTDRKKAFLFEVAPVSCEGRAAYPYERAPDAQATESCSRPVRARIGCGGNESRSTAICSLTAMHDAVGSLTMVCIAEGLRAYSGACRLEAVIALLTVVQILTSSEFGS
jgi:hypothetical protein